MKKITLGIALITTLSLSVEPDIAWGFDYPIGNKGYLNGNKISLDEHIKDWGNGYNVDRNEEYNLGKGIVSNNSRGGSTTTGWYNINDVGNFYSGKGGKGLHPGEDWNKIGGDAGEQVYAIANGVVEEISKVGSTYSNRAWKIIIKHKLPDNTFVYSIYLHVTSSDNDDGTITTDENDFSFQEGDKVIKGAVIGRIASNMSSGLDSHLHFAIRNKFTSGSDLYANANSNGYYTHDKKMHTSMTKSQIITTFTIMKNDGILDPSDFIDDHRDIYPWIGNGSIISYHGANHNPNILDEQYPFGITQDITKTHTKLNDISTLVKQVGFFQWQPNANCENIEISHTGVNNNVNVTVGSWNTRDNDKTYKNVTLPFVVGESDFNNNGTDWRVIAVTFNNGTVNYSSNSDVTNNLTAICTDEAPTYISDSDIEKNKRIMIGEHQWNGNASIISRIFQSGYQNYHNNRMSYIDNWAFGVFHDVTVVHKNQYKPVVFFQWMSSDVCEELVIDSTLDSSEKKVSLGVKNWSSNSYNNLNVTLPYTIKSEQLWSVIKVAFDKPVSKDARVTATCKELE